MTSPLSVSTRYGQLSEALHDARERESLEQQLTGYLRGQRWFGGQARELEAVSLERWVELESGACVCAVSVTDSEGVRTDHQLPLLLAAASGERRHVVDALSSGAVREELLRLSLSGGTREGHRARFVCESLGDGNGCGGEGRLVGVEQSNSSVVYGEECILKVYRRLEQGANPEVELGRYLTAEAGFSATPRVLATARLEGPGGYGADALMVQQYVPNSGDGWAWALEAAKRALADVDTPARLRDWLDAERQTVEGAASLGVITARMHAALASAEAEGLKPQQVTKQDIRAWHEELGREARDVVATVERAGLDDPELLSAVRTLEGGGPGGAQSNAAGGLRTRVHGDYHLGQVLKTDEGFVVLDFEGEPARTLPERRALQHPLVDVAGMVRSWSYAAHTAAQDRGSPELATAWEAKVRDSFLQAYWEAASSSHPRFLPADEQTRENLLALFELRKALYEVRYELNNRPAWVGIPAAAVRRLAAHSQFAS